MRGNIRLYDEHKISKMERCGVDLSGSGQGTLAASFGHNSK
jgi:hypothetical protein